MRSSTNGQGKLLIPVDDRLPIPPRSLLRHVRGIIYIVPATGLLPEVSVYAVNAT